MKNLSIIINCDSGNSIDNLLSVLEPLLKDDLTELILLCKNPIQIKTVHKHRVYCYLDKDIISLSKEMCTSSRIMMFDEIEEINDKLVNELIIFLQEERNLSYSYNRKVYLSEDRINFYLEDKILIYNKMGYTYEKTSVILEDFSLLNKNDEAVVYNTKKLLSERKYAEIVCWYNKFLSSLTKPKRYLFYTKLEFEKAKLSNEVINYLKSEITIAEDDINYSNYIKLDSLLSKDANSEEALRLIKNTSIKIEDIYFSYLLYKLFKANSITISLLKCFDRKILGEFVKYLLNTMDDYYLSLYKYIISIDITKEFSKNTCFDLNIYQELIKAYIEVVPGKNDNNEFNNYIIQMFTDYVNIGLFLINIKDAQVNKNVKMEEIKFLIEIDKAIAYLDNNDILAMSKIMYNAVNSYPEIKGAVELFIIKTLREKKQEEVERNIALQKKTIEEMINNGDFINAEKAINEILELSKDDPEIYSYIGLIKLLQEQFKEAINSFNAGLEIDNKNFDILYNLGYLYNLQNDLGRALHYYNKALEVCSSDELKETIETAINDIKLTYSYSERKKVAIFVRKGMDSFLQNVITALSVDYEVKKYTLEKLDDMRPGLEWANIYWFEWCDELIIYASKLNLPLNKRVICRIHSYEAFTDNPTLVNWENVDKVIFSAKHIKDIVQKSTGLPDEKIEVIPIGIDLYKYKFLNRRPGFNIAYLGYVNYKKGPMLLIQFIHELAKRDKRYKLYIGGSFQDQRDILYFRQMIREFNLEDNIIFSGWINDVDTWLADKDYIVSTSLLEGQQLSLMEAMSKGIKPIIHNFVGARGIYADKYIFNTIGEGADMVMSPEYSSREYRDFIKNRYNVENEREHILRSVHELIEKVNTPSKLPLVTVGVLSYNYGHYISEAIESTLKQSYPNIEILIIDDCSRDNSREIIEKYKNSYDNINVIFHEKNSGSAVQGFKDVIAKAQGEYFTYLSADDYFADEYVIERFMHSFMRDEKLDYVYGNTRVVDETGKFKTVWKYGEYTDDEIVYNTFTRMGSGVIPLTAGMFKKAFYLRNNLDWVHDEKNIVAGDSLNTLVNVKYGWKRKYIDVDIICYRHHENNMTYNLKQRILSIISVIEYISNNFNESIYLTKANWQGFDSTERKGMKNFLMGLFYNDTLKYYSSNQFKPWDGAELNFSKEEIAEFVQPLIQMRDAYFKKAIEISDVFIGEIEKILHN